ncbi:uncharacterized protein LOC132734424 [Ruditapes philippinarum]|uniref:uncharacterized protein LOC132734424 n=1 Tax=Ruditapes philippinarum TaxID=129788 RepID=UPI00295A6F58|nr:uncharacterized protein LOC132734424 [Ruditapes philippinarum]XP_060577146.1 uncharacterized protein LOC132734424 [Ruditapes philippinarum]
MTTEIEAAYAQALDKLEKYKSASYEETKKEISNLIEREKVLFAQDIYPTIDEAIGHYMSGNITECEKVFKDMEDTRLITGITFEKVIPHFIAEGNSLVSVEEVYIPEQLDWETCCRYMSDNEPVCDSDNSNESDDGVDVAKCIQDSTRDK